MSTLPAGSVTFLFTDIEGSTRLLRELGDGYAEVLAAHRHRLRTAFARHGGVEVDTTQGDAFFIAFARAEDAAAAAMEGQRELRDGPVRVRMGLHTGEPLVTDEGYVGVDVHRAARIAAAAHGDQVVLSQQTRRALSAGLMLLDLGEHRLRDLPEPEWLFQLVVPGLPETFPPLKTMGNTNLPFPSSRLVGRERELLELLAPLRSGEPRLFTLTGPGGIGKTRLAIEVGLGLLDRFPNGVFFVELAPLADPELVVPGADGDVRPARARR